jgi:protein involved in polysaccharide export with SLBB domain
MNSFFKGLLFFLLTVVSGGVLFAQINPLATQNLSTVKVDQLSDAEIASYIQKAKEGGLSEPTVYRLLQEKGLPAAEIAKLKERIALTQQPLNMATDGKSDAATKPATSERTYDEAAVRVPMQKNETDLAIYGAALFSTSSMVFEPNLRIATPGGYVLGPDDELLINVYGFSEKSYALPINAEGFIYIPQVGPVAVSGLTIEQASQKIKSKLAATIYKAISSGGTSVQISLGKIKSIRVTVIGEVSKPGTYTISSLTSLFNLLYLCGGPSNTGSYRQIELIRDNEIKRKIDLYNFLQKGSQQDNVLLKEGDVVRVPFYKNRIVVTGQVKQKGKYELLTGETFTEVLNYCGGFADEAYKTLITIYQLTDTERRVINLAKSDFAKYQPLSSDSIVVGKLQNLFSNKLSVSGAVMQPGDYEYKEGLSLKTLIEKAGGVKPDVFSKRGNVNRKDEQGLPIQLQFDIDSILKGQTTVLLKKMDSVVIYSIFDLDNEAFITIDGNIRRPGKYQWMRNITLYDLILNAGGVTESGDLSNIEIARRIGNVQLTQLNHAQSEIIMVDLSDSAMQKDVVLMPNDVINIRQYSGFARQRTVFLEGMVLNPGRYTLQMSGDRISDVIKRAGGFRANADTTALVIKRIAKKNITQEERQKIFTKLLNIKQDSLNSAERLKNEIYRDYDKISIDLVKALRGQQTENMLLEDGDVLTIEPNDNLVKVSGEVYFPTIIPFEEGASFKYYIQKSGSYTELARKKGTMVIYPDGKAKRVKRFLFFTSYPKVVSRSEIFVPQKNNANKQPFTIAEWSVVLSSLAIVANVIINLSR